VFFSDACSLVNLTAQVVGRYCSAFPLNILESRDLLREALLAPFAGKIPYNRTLDDECTIASLDLFGYCDEGEAVSLVHAFVCLEQNSQRLGSSDAGVEDVLKCVTAITGEMSAKLFKVVDNSVSFAYTYNKADRSNSTTGDGRPDECVYIKDFLAFKAEHELAAIDVAIAELTEKLQSYNEMDYGRHICFLPMVAAGGVELEFGLIDVRTHAYQHIRRLDVRNRQDRCDCLVLAINVFRLLRTMAPVIPARANPQWGSKRGNDKIIFVNNVVRKRITGGETCPEDLYRLLASGSVPRSVQVRRTRHHLEVSPVGWCISPEGYEIRTKQELWMAISHVLEALIYLHDRGFVHRDVRWSNVIQVKSATPSYCIIDFELACRNSERMTLQNYIHVQVVGFRKPYFASHDVWLLSNMIEKWYAVKGLPMEHNVNSFIESCRTTKATAVKALKAWKAVQFTA
jgi:hypothetical protein